MTGKQITEEAARLTYPDLPQEAIEKISVAIWEADPHGELYHVFVIEDLLNDETCKAEVPKYVKSLRHVESVAAEFRARWKPTPEEEERMSQ
jgi:hypothetical protein